MFDAYATDWAQVESHLRRQLAGETSARGRIRIVATWMYREPPEICRRIVKLLEAEHADALAWAAANRRLVDRHVLEYLPKGQFDAHDC